MATDPFRTINIHMHYGGHFIWKPTIRYTSDRVRVFFDEHPDELSPFEFERMYDTIEKGAANMNFWYSIPNHGLDVGVVAIKDDVDIELLTTCYEGLENMHIYAERGPEPIEAVSPDGKLLYKRVTGDGPLAIQYHASWHADSGRGKEKSGANEDAILIEDDDHCDISHLEATGEGISGEGPSHIGPDPAVVGPREEEAEDYQRAKNKSKRKSGKAPIRGKATIVREAEIGKRKRKTARKSVRRLYTENEETNIATPTDKGGVPSTPTTVPDAEEEPVEQEDRLDTSELPDWLREGLEEPDDDDVFGIGSGQPEQHPIQQEAPEQQPFQRQESTQNQPQNSEHTAATREREGARCQQEDEEESDEEEDWDESIEEDEDVFDAGIESDQGNDPGYTYFNAEQEFKKEHFDLKPGLKFTSFTKFREALVEWNVKEGYETYYIRNEGKRITAKCAKGCSWRIHASEVQKTQTFMIKSLDGEHHCGRDYSNKHATSTFLSKKFQDKIRDDPDCSIPGLVKETRRLFMIDITQKKASRLKQKAKDILRGHDMEQYHRLWDYVHTVRESNPDSHISLQIDRRTIEDRATF